MCWELAVIQGRQELYSHDMAFWVSSLSYLWGDKSLLPWKYLSVKPFVPPLCPNKWPLLLLTVFKAQQHRHLRSNRALEQKYYSRNDKKLPPVYSTGWSPLSHTPRALSALVINMYIFYSNPSAPATQTEILGPDYPNFQQDLHINGDSVTKFSYRRDSGKKQGSPANR